uniref:murein hydrolase activator EnvC family protein n=1 Tax=Candidatus Limnocylindrus sp. TaxID=2802978 RepID=UPI004049E6A8
MKHSPAQKQRTWRARLGVLLTIPLLIVGLGLAQAGPVRGDPLDDALAQQKALAAQLAAQQKALNSLIAQQGALTAQLASTSAALAKNTATLTSITTQVAQLSTALAQAQVGLNKLNAAVNALDVEISRLVRAQEAKARDLSARQAILASRIREAYIADQTPPLWVLLSGQSFTDILLDIAGFNALGAEDVKLADSISRDAARLAEIEDQVRANRAETEKLRVAAATQKAALDKQVSLLNAAKVQLATAIAAQKKAIAAQKAAMDKVIADKAKLAAAVAALKAEEARVAATVSSLLKSQFGSGLPTVYQGGWTWPVLHSGSGFVKPVGAYRPYISQKYGCVSWKIYPKNSACPRGYPYFHSGVDIAAAAGTPLYAAAAGKVMIAGICSYCTVWKGMRPLAWIWIAHSKSMVSIYGHIGDGKVSSQPKWRVKAGDIVAAGQLIGFVGSTGNVTGPHLHLSLLQSGKYVCIQKYLPGGACPAY